MTLTAVIVLAGVFAVIFTASVPLGLYMCSVFDGSLSGAQIREAVSWGKVKPEAKKMTVEGDATISLPIIYAAVMDRL